MEKWIISREIFKIILLINKYKWKGIDCPLYVDDWKTFEKNNSTIALNILYIKEKEIFPAYISKINSNCENKYDSKWRKRRMTLSCSKKLSALFYGITSKYFYCFDLSLFF